MVARKHHRPLERPVACLPDLDAIVPRTRDAVIRSLECIYAELLHCASLSCATASTVAASRRGEDGSLVALRALLPPAPSTFPAVMGCILEDAELQDLVEILRRHYELQDLARGLTELHGSAHSGHGSAGSVENVAAAWREVAALAVEALIELDCALPHSASAPGAKQLRPMLELVSSGRRVDHADCVLPHLSATGERRWLTRASVMTYVLVERGTSLNKFLVTNVSRRGLGLEGLSDATPGEEMRVNWKPGAALVARVSWADAHRFGLEIVENTTLAEDFIRSLLVSEPLPASH
jgi:hypothetical protein